ncbi:hypothetical protein SAMN02745194_04091 [Roseomonas rosea]|uniref:Exonuclease n=1 Tax=Muricoccus roseus TaxID=198092 RepID=A0A1M6PFE5_9PROT|nr:hypothetical protein [Roseomonas rosea]SHK06641.1 hypothetical protein SAMN02745194_04091 [Roseomonas rosea]
MIAFIDFEASSLGANSHPIEVGWFRADEEVAEAHLIRPAEGWTDWAAASECIHGISREVLLQEGRPVMEVALRLLQALPPGEVLVFSDAPAWDQDWLDTLFREAGLPRRIVLLDVHQAYGRACRPLLELVPEWHPRREARVQEINRLAARLVAEAGEAESRRRRTRHRAGPDAEGLSWTWREVQRRVVLETGGA